MPRPSQHSRGQASSEERQLITISKALSKTLRHTALSEGLKLQDDGYANVAELLALKKYRDLGLDFQTLQHVVDNNNKSRFKLIKKPDPEDSASKAAVHAEAAAQDGVPVTNDAGSMEKELKELTIDPVPQKQKEGEISSSTTTTPTPTPTATATTAAATEEEGETESKEIIPPDADPSDYLIRANQGHSIAIESHRLLNPITASNLPPICLHATFYAAIDPIISTGGLSCMGRTHIHCAPGLPEPSKHPVTGEDIPAVKSGMRFDAEVLMYVDLAKAIADGVPVWNSENGVILIEGKNGSKILPMEYIERIEDWKGRAGGGNLWTREDGVVKEWPQGGKQKFERNKGKPGGKRGGGGGRRV